MTPENTYSVLLQKQRAAGVRLLDLTVTNPTEHFPDYPHREIARSYGTIARFDYEPAALGMKTARQIVADWYLAQGIPAQANRIALTASTSEAYGVLFKLLCNPGDEILIPCPSYPLFEYLACAEAVKTAAYRLDYDGSWFIDFDSVDHAVSPRSKAIVVVNPNNPTGSFLKVDEAAKLVALAEKHQLAIISDEVFMSYPSAGYKTTQVRTFVGNEDILSFSLNGLSKAAGMPQMKLGWIVVNGPDKEVDSALSKLELLLDSYLSVSTPVQNALEGLLRIGSGIQEAIRARLLQNRKTLAVLNGSVIEPLPGEGGWSAILQLPNIRSEDDWTSRLLEEEAVIVQPGYFFDMPREAYVVVSLLSLPADLAEGLAKLKRVATVD